MLSDGFNPFNFKLKGRAPICQKNCFGGVHQIYFGDYFICLI